MDQHFADHIVGPRDPGRSHQEAEQAGRADSPLQAHEDKRGCQRHLILVEVHRAQHNHAKPGLVRHDQRIQDRLHSFRGGSLALLVLRRPQPLHVNWCALLLYGLAVAQDVLQDGNAIGLQRSHEQAQRQRVVKNQHRLHGSQTYG